MGRAIYLTPVPAGHVTGSLYLYSNSLRATRHTLDQNNSVTLKTETVFLQNSGTLNHHMVQKPKRKLSSD
jgi:hypothetical protein